MIRILEVAKEIRLTLHPVSLLGATLSGIPQMTLEMSWIFVIFCLLSKAEVQFGQLPSPQATQTTNRKGLSGPHSGSNVDQGQCLSWVRLAKTQTEHNTSALQRFADVCAVVGFPSLWANSRHWFVPRSSFDHTSPLVDPRPKPNFTKMNSSRSTISDGPIKPSYGFVTSVPSTKLICGKFTYGMEGILD
jgi:hypothetical protein